MRQPDRAGATRWEHPAGQKTDLGEVQTKYKWNSVTGRFTVKGAKIEDVSERFSLALHSPVCL